MCEACEETTEGEEFKDEVSEPIEEEGENARTGGGVATTAGGFCSGSKGEQDGESLWKSCRMGKVKARGVGETMSTAGMKGTSVVTSRPAGRDGNVDGEYKWFFVLVGAETYFVSGRECGAEACLFSFGRKEERKKRGDAGEFPRGKKIIGRLQWPEERRVAQQPRGGGEQLARGRTISKTIRLGAL